MSKLSFLSDSCIIYDPPSADGYESIQKNVSLWRSAACSTTWTASHAVNKVMNTLSPKPFFSIVSPFKTY